MHFLGDLIQALNSSYIRTTPKSISSPWISLLDLRLIYPMACWTFPIRCFTGIQPWCIQNDSRFPLSTCFSCRIPLLRKGNPIFPVPQVKPLDLFLPFYAHIHFISVSDLHLKYTSNLAHPNTSTAALQTRATPHATPWITKILLSCILVSSLSVCISSSPRSPSVFPET